MQLQMQSASSDEKFVRDSVIFMHVCLNCQVPRIFTLRVTSLEESDGVLGPSLRILVMSPLDVSANQGKVLVELSLMSTAQWDRRCLAPGGPSVRSNFWVIFLFSFKKNKGHSSWPCLYCLEVVASRILPRNGSLPVAVCFLLNVRECLFDRSISRLQGIQPTQRILP